MKTFTQFREETEDDIIERGEAFLAAFLARGKPVGEREWKNSKIKMKLKDYDGDAFDIKDLSSFEDDMKRAGLDHNQAIKRGIELAWEPRSNLGKEDMKQVPKQLLKARKDLPNQMGKTGDVVMQEPVPDKVALKYGYGDPNAKTGGNKRAQIGQMMGFGQLDKAGRQIGVLGKTPGGKNLQIYPVNPTFKQKAKLNHDD
jgi:hypothetical protein